MLHLVFLLSLLSGVISSVSESVTPAKFSLNPKSRISEGFRADINEFPWHVYILANGPGTVSTCGGSILSEWWILTAAHCTHDYSSLDLYFGSTDVYSMPIIISSTYWVEHAEYNPANYNNDVAVVQLEIPLNFSDSIQPINLLSWNETENDFADTVATVLGFGYTSDDNPEESACLLYTHVRIIPNSNCTEHYGDSIVTNNTICATGNKASSNSICSGDSGGAMIIENDNGDNIQIGINSFVSNTGCTTGSPSGYARVAKYLNWIYDKTDLKQNIKPRFSKLKINKI